MTYPGLITDLVIIFLFGIPSVKKFRARRKYIHWDFAVFEGAYVDRIH